MRYLCGVTLISPCSSAACCDATGGGVSLRGSVYLSGANPDAVVGVLEAALANGGPDKLYTLQTTAENPTVAGFADLRKYNLTQQFIGKAIHTTAVARYNDSTWWTLSTDPSHPTSKQTIVLVCARAARPWSGSSSFALTQPHASSSHVGFRRRASARLAAPLGIQDRTLRTSTSSSRPFRVRSLGPPWRSRQCVGAPFRTEGCRRLAGPGWGACAVRHCAERSRFVAGSCVTRQVSGFCLLPLYVTAFLVSFSGVWVWGLGVWGLVPRQGFRSVFWSSASVVICLCVFSHVHVNY